MTTDPPDLAEKNFELFTGAIDEAIDKLFTPLAEKNIKTQLEPATAKDIPEPDPSSKKPSPPIKQNILFNRAEEALMSLEWDVTPININNFQDILQEIQKIVCTKYELKKLFHLSNEVLSVLKESPQNAPISGPKALKDTLRFLREIDESANTAEDTPPQIAAIIKRLQTAIPPAAKPSTTRKSPPPQDNRETATITNVSVLDTDISSCTTISYGLYSALEYNVSILENTIRLIIPVENLFNKTKGYEQFYAILNKVRAQLSKQLNYYHNALASDYKHTNNAGNTKPPDILFHALQSHISLIIQCEKRVIPAERIFKKTVGMEKLYAIHRRLREQLGKQHTFLERVSNGKYRISSEQGSECISNAKPTPPVCPWKNLTVYNWGGKQTAFVPEQIAFTGEVDWWAKTRLKYLNTFPLRLLKTWFWTPIKPKLKNNLQKHKENQLKDMTIPILQQPSPYIKATCHAKKGGVLILNYDKTTAAAFVNLSIENLEVSPDTSWEVCLHKNSIVAGYLTINNQVIPVVSLENLK